jgi:hypothetical protein
MHMVRSAFGLALVMVVVFACGSERPGFDDGKLPDGGLPNGDSACGQQCPFDTVCVPNLGCVPCAPGKHTCVGNDVHDCTADGKPGAKLSTCDASKGLVCSGGSCATACEAAAQSESNVGCEFWAVDLDLADGPTDPASAQWALVLSNASEIPATVRIEKNDAPVGQPIKPSLVHEATIPVGDLVQVIMPTREIDCGQKPNDHDAPGTCLTSNAFRVTSSAPIVAYQFNNVVHNYSTDASLLLPTPVLGTKYRNIGWPSGSPFKTPVAFVQRSYVTIIGTQAGTSVTVRPSWRIKGNGPIQATKPGESLTLTLGPFDVLNLETDDGTMNECSGPNAMKPPYCTDLTGTIIESSAPVAVFTGVESTGVGSFEAPKPPSWNESSGCCKQHIEEQLPPLHAIGKKFVVTRSPIRSDQDLSDYVEPDILRFVGAAATAVVTTNLPAPLDHFSIAPGQVIDTWTQKDIVVTSTEPIMIAQFLMIQDFVNGKPKGDPSFTIFPPVEQTRNEYTFLSPKGWTENYVVISAAKGVAVKVDGAVPSNCVIAEAGTLDGKVYEARRCPLKDGVHRLTGDGGFGIMAYGYGDADAYSFAGGAYVKKIYVPPPLK